MKSLYLDCGMGAAGDMLTAALIELMPDPEKTLSELNKLNIPGVIFEKEISSKCGINGTHISVKINGVEESEDMHEHHHDHEHSHEHEHHHDHDHSHEHEHHHDHDNGHEHEHHHDHNHDHEHEHYHDHDPGHHHHSSVNDIKSIVGSLNIPSKVKEDVMAVYSLIAEAESHAHGKPVNEIHFHEVGTMDAIADVTAVCLLMNMLSPDKIVVSPIHVGSGHVKCAHGILPVPTPATAFILKDVPIYGGGIKSELCTPTGAALLKHFATSFGDMPVMKISSIGYGMGKKDFQAANCVRAMFGETSDTNDAIAELNCNIDDMTPEEVGFAINELFKVGALDVFTTPIQMKKNRPGILLTVLCKEDIKESIIENIFKHTSTIGIREKICQRYVLNRTTNELSTPYGPVRAKISSGYGVTREKYEYDDVAKIASENNLSYAEVISTINKELI
ncbi:MAG: nickel pincer cofactor biosynthesis protein LarC [Lachnospiraceae bacterium]|nr:nickel pincer cofactor biosynthesis protein LarC [Lachnospiraceae bacterium]